MNKNIIIIPAHITNTMQVQTLQRCIEHIRKYCTYPILVSFSGDTKFFNESIRDADEFVFTSVNTILEIQNGMETYFSTPGWSLIRTILPPRTYHAYAHLQKICLGLEAGLLLNYEQFLVINYDALVMDDTFIDTMFSSNEAIVFKYDNSDFTNTDVIKFNKHFANMFKRLNDYNVYKNVASSVEAEMFEIIVTKFIIESGCYVKQLKARAGTAYQLDTFKVLINSSSSSEASAVLINGVVHILVTSQGSPAHTLDNTLTIKYKDKVISMNVVDPTSHLLPIAEYESEDMYMTVVTSFGEFPLVVKKDTLEHTRVEFYN